MCNDHGRCMFNIAAPLRLFCFPPCAQLWPAVYWQVITALFTFQLFMIGILGAKGSYTSSVVVPLLFITVIFARVCAGIFERPFQVMSLRNAVDLDRNDQVSRSPDC